MKAILVDENKNLVWSEVDEPVISDTQVLIEIYAAALNRADLLQRAGKYPSPAGCPPWMGLEVAAYHAWVVAVVNGEERFFDPTAELNASNKNETYTTERYY